MESRRISSLEGLRGVMAFSVFNAHVIPSLFPGVTDARIWGVISYTPFFAILMAGLGVSYFFFISAFGIYQSESDKVWWKIVLNIVKRYFRLVPIILISNLLCWASMRWGIFYVGEGEDYVSYDLNSSIWRPVMEAFIWVFRGINSFSSVFWTIEAQFKGIIIISIVLIITRKLDHRIQIIISAALGIAIYFLQRDSAASYMICMVAGSICFNIVAYLKSSARVGVLFLNIKQIYCLMLIVLEGIVLWRHTNLLNSRLDYTYLCWILFIILIPFLILAESKLKILLENKYILAFGKYSFAIYGIHELIRSTLGYAMLKKIGEKPDLIEGILIYISCLLVTLIVASVLTFLNRNLQEKVVNPVFHYIEEIIGYYFYPEKYNRKF